jgi:putative transposase
MPAATTCTRPQPRSAKTTRWCVSRTCRCGTCPGRRQGRTDAAGKKRSGQVGPEQVHPRPGLVRVPPPTGLQAGMERRHLIAVPPQNTSRTCPCCGHVSADNRQTQARFACVECGFEENADVVGAINVLRAGHARLACEVSGAVRPPAAGTRRSDLGAAQCRA